MNEIIKSIIATILYKAVLELVAIWIFIPEKLGIEDYDANYLLIQGALQFIIIIGFINLKNRKGNQILWQHASIKWYLAAGILGCLFVILQSLLNLIYNLLFETNYSIKYDFDGISELGEYNILSIVLFIPIAEELFFKGYLQNELQKKNKPWVAILVASILFASVHGPEFNLIELNLRIDWHLVYITFFIGLISGVLYNKSKSIGPSILFHAFCNLIATIV